MKHLLLLISVLCLQYSLQAQTFEIRLNAIDDSTMAIQLRETSGNNTPTTSNQITDISFAVKWPNICNLAVDNINTTNYNITKSGGINSHNNFNYQAFFADNTPFLVPNNWAVNQWETIAKLNITGTGACTFEIAELGFHFSTDPNVGIDLNDFTPTINGSGMMPPPPACPDQSDIQQASGSENICNNPNGNTITLPFVQVTGDGANNATFQWSTPMISNVPSGQSPTVTLPQNATCGSITFVFNLSVGCTEDSNVGLNGGTFTYVLYPEPTAPTVTRDDDVCNYTVTPACSGDVVSPNTVSNQAPGTTGATQNFQVSNGGCSAKSFTVAIPDCPMDCPTQADIQQASGSNNSCNNTNGNTITLPTVTVSGNNVANATFQWTSSTVNNIPSGQSPTITLPQNTDCGSVNHTFTLVISCTKDNNVHLDGGNVSYTVYPEPKAPTVTKDDNVCNYTVTPACPSDNVSPNTVPSQSPGTTGLTQNFQVSNTGCATQTFNVTIPDCPNTSTGNCGWEIESVNTKCNVPTFLVCLAATEAVTSVIGVDFHLTYPTSIRPTGNKQFGIDLYSDVTVLTASLNIDVVGSELDAGVNFKSSAPVNASFNGTGRLICLEFEFTNGFNSSTLPTITSEFVLESYEGNVVGDCLEASTIQVDTDNQHTGYLYVWGNSIKHLTDDPNNPITGITEANSACITTTNNTALKGDGSFVVNWTDHVQLTRWNNNCQPLSPVVGGFDAYLVSLIANRDDSYVPDIRALVAGDVNEDGNTTSGDATNILQRSVGKDCDYFVQAGREKSDWKFIDTTTINNADNWQLDTGYPANNDNGADWLNVPISPQCFDIPEGNTNCGRTSMVYEAILKGDLGNNWNQSYHFKTVGASEAVVDLDNTVELPTNSYQIPIYYQGEGVVNAIDIRLNLSDITSISFDTVTLVNENSGLQFDYNILGDTSLLIASFSIDSEGIPTDEPLFYVQITATDKPAKVDFDGGTVHLNGVEGSLTYKEGPTVGINDVNPQLSLYPNPTQNQVTIAYENFVNANTTIKVFDYTGKLVQQHTNLPTNKFTMNTQQMSSGIYFVVLEQGGQVIGREKLVVMK